MPYAYIGPQSSGRVILQSVPRLVSEDCSWPCHSHSHRVSLSHSPVRYFKAALMKTVYLCFVTFLRMKIQRENETLITCTCATPHSLPMALLV
jgi:hypothetical protein